MPSQWLRSLTRLQAHIKSALIGASVTIPIKDGKLVRAHVLIRLPRRAPAHDSPRRPELGKEFGISSSGPASISDGLWPPSRAKRCRQGRAESRHPARFISEHKSLKYPPLVIHFKSTRFIHALRQTPSPCIPTHVTAAVLTAFHSPRFPSCRCRRRRGPLSWVRNPRVRRRPA